MYKLYMTTQLGVGFLVKYILEVYVYCCIQIQNIYEIKIPACLFTCNMNYSSHPLTINVIFSIYLKCMGAWGYICIYYNTNQFGLYTICKHYHLLYVNSLGYIVTSLGYGLPSICTAHFTFTPHTAAFNISLELQGECTDQLTLICRHSLVPTDPSWIHNGTADGGQLVDTAFPGSNYSFQNRTEHRVTVTGLDDVAALDGYVFHCVYSIHGTLIKSNAIKYSFLPYGQSHAQLCIIVYAYTH